VLDLSEARPLDIPAVLRHMGQSAREMLGDALTALAQSNASLARSVRAADQQVDEYQKQMFAWIQEEIPRHVDALRAAIDLLSVARRFERIADLSTNIAEDVIFLIEGSQVRHAHD
jgi:phosphate transport system protein